MPVPVSFQRYSWAVFLALQLLCYSHYYSYSIPTALLCYLSHHLPPYLVSVLFPTTPTLSPSPGLSSGAMIFCFNFLMRSWRPPTLFRLRLGAMTGVVLNTPVECGKNPAKCSRHLPSMAQGPLPRLSL